MAEDWHAMLRRAQFSILCVLLLAYSADARTWRVLRDGSGDFTTLQPASNAAAAGDTIWIGPGRYAEKTNFVANTKSGLSWPVYLGIVVDHLTIIGAHRDSVVIGPDKQVPGEIGIVPRYGSGEGSTIEALTVQKVFRGIEHEAAVTIRNVSFLDCGSGVVGGESSALVEDCTFRSCQSGVSAHSLTADYRVSRCAFLDNLTGINFTGSQNPVVDGCWIESGGTGVVASGLGVRLLLRDTTILNAENACVAIQPDAELCSYGNAISTTGYVAIRLSSANRFEMRQTRVSGGWGATIELVAQRDSVIVRNNEILRGSGYSVRTDCYTAGFDSVVLDLSGNYWGTVDEDSLRAWIWDRNDDPSEFARVLYAPFLTDYVRVARRSLGSLKSAFDKP